MQPVNQSRRHFLAGTGACLLLPGVALADEKKGDKPGEQKPVGAVEDLMREHGVLRRALLVYAECTPAIRHEASTVDAPAINLTAKLFRDFGEDYHEKKLEEAYIFPALRKTSGPAAGYVDVLIAQHKRGREITDYVLDVTRTGGISANNSEQLASVLGEYVLMYENHTAREDTIVFPAWKTAISEQQLQEFAEKFEDIEKEQFGTDGFEDAVDQIGKIEQRLGFADLARFTPPPPQRT